MAEMFEKASRLNLRFATNKGNLTTEDLWDLSLANLNVIAKDLNKQIKASEEEDFLKTEKRADTELKLKFEIVIHILNTKKAEQEKRELAAEKAEKKQKLLEIMERQENASLEKLSPEELRAKIAELT